MTDKGYFGIVSGNKYYHVHNHPEDEIRIVIYDNSAITMTGSSDSLSETT